MNTEVDFNHMSLDDFLEMLKTRKIEVDEVLASEEVEEETEEVFVERVLDGREKKSRGRPYGKKY